MILFKNLRRNSHIIELRVLLNGRDQISLYSTEKVGCFRISDINEKNTQF